MIYVLIFALVVFGVLRQHFPAKKTSTAPKAHPATPSSDRLGEDVAPEVAEPRVKWAIIIGIDRYTYKGSWKNRKRVSASGHELTGPGDLRECVKDALGVKHYLETVKMDPNNIKLLLAPVETEGRDYKFALPDKSEHEEPTYANIVRALAEVPSYAKRNHLVLVHYSGHGGQATTVFAALKKKSSDAVDHSLMPADAAPTGRYLRDVELGALLQDIVAVGAVLTVVLDCCHSSGAIRGDDDADDKEDSDRFFFGPTHRPRVYAAPVQSVEKHKKRVTLAGGRFHGVQKGAEYLIMPLNFELDRRVHTKDVLARVRIGEVQPGTSTAEILDDPPLNSWLGEG